jgi:hypothetical protein
MLRRQEVVLGKNICYTPCAVTRKAIQVTLILNDEHDSLAFHD